MRILSQQSAPGRNERVVTHLNVSVSDRTKSGIPIVVIVLKPRGSYLIDRFYRNRSGHLKLTNRDKAHQILADRMDSQCLVS